MATTVRWGILGCGHIARIFASDLFRVKNARLVAVASRDQSAADVFGAEFSVYYRHNSYEALAQNPDVDVIYVATPHTFHYAHTMLCLKHKKAVLCEKPFAIHAHQVEEMQAEARRNQVFLMEGLWTKFLPHFQKTCQLIAEGVIGDLQMIQADFGFRASYDPSSRLFDPNLGGGSLLDVGVYTVFLALALAGKPLRTEAVMTPAPTGVDGQCAMLLHHENNVVSQLFSSLLSHTPTEAIIYGTHGRLHLAPLFYSASSMVRLYTDTHRTGREVFNQKVAGSGFQYEASHVTECLLEGLTESPMHTFADSQLLMETLDIIRQKAGIHF